MDAKLASECDEFPYCYPGRVLYFTVGDRIEQCYTRDDLRVATRAALAGTLDLYAAWPGNYRTDLFHIDKPELLAKVVLA